MYRKIDLTTWLDEKGIKKLIKLLLTERQKIEVKIENPEKKYLLHTNNPENKKILKEITENKKPIKIRG